MAREVPLEAAVPLGPEGGKELTRRRVRGAERQALRLERSWALLLQLLFCCLHLFVSSDDCPCRTERALAGSFSRTTSDSVIVPEDYDVFLGGETPALELKSQPWSSPPSFPLDRCLRASAGHRKSHIAGCGPRLPGFAGAGDPPLPQPPFTPS